MSMTLEEAIKQYEQIINIWENHNLTESQEIIEQLTTELREAEGCVKEFDKKYIFVIKQLTAWLKELAERRKEPEIIRCHECIYFKDMTVTVGYCEKDMMYQYKDYFCKEAKRSTE